jgi:hypothetical protein
MSRAFYRTFLTLASQNFFIFFFLYAGCHQVETGGKNRKVFIKKAADGYKLYRNGQPFSVKGAAGYSHLSKLKEVGGNTIRTWDTVNIASILDEAHAHDIAVIVGLPIPESKYSTYFYEDSLKVARQYQGIKKIVDQYKAHPALLMWCLGNELGFYETFDQNAFYNAFNNLVDMIHWQDPDHPVTTALVVFQRMRIINIKFKTPQLDLISFNTFGRLTYFKKHLDNFSWFWKGPYLITEWGINGPWEAESTAWGAPIEDTSTKKAEQYQQRYEQYMPTLDPRFLGSFVFYWGQKQERTPTWFSLFSEDGMASEAVGTLQYVWTGTRPANLAPFIQYMLVDNKGARDNIIFEVNAVKTAEVLMHDPEDDPVTIHWQILPEDWYYEYEDSVRIPKPMDELIIATDEKKLQFRTPSQEGPYRIFVEAFDNQGNYATANTPIYVIE